MTKISKDTPIYVAPANPAGKALAENLKQQGYNIVGLADNLKKDSNIVNHASHALPDSIVVIAIGSFTNHVAAGLRHKGFHKNQLWTINARTQVRYYRAPISYQFKQIGLSLLTKIFKILRRFIPNYGYVYYAEDFFDSNVLLAYREHRRQFPEEAWLLGRRIRHSISELESDTHVLKEQSWITIWRYLTAKKIIVDHEYTGKTFNILRQSIPVIQLWHGLVYKALSGNIHYKHICDEVFISSSPWFNEHIFPNLFRAKRYLALGYPRNDVFFQLTKQRDWINSESEELMHEVKKNTGDLIIYAPTYRDWGDNDYPLNLAEIEQWCAQHQISFILKFHPFISRKFGDAMGIEQANNLQAIPGMPHIYLYPSGKNIYPWLADALALITDYSSIAFDFAISNKPTFYFQYDLQQYKNLRGKTVIPDDWFATGPIACNQNELLKQLTNMLDNGEDESYIAQRQKSAAIFYQEPTTAADKIVTYLKKN